MKNKKKYSGREIDKLIYDYFDNRVKAVRSEYRQPYKIFYQPFFARETILTTVFSFAVIIMLILGSFSYNKQGRLAKNITVYYEYKQFDKRLPGVIEYIRDLDIFNIRRTL